MGWSETTSIQTLDRRVVHTLNISCMHSATPKHVPGCHFESPCILKYSEASIYATLRLHWLSCCAFVLYRFDTRGCAGKLIKYQVLFEAGLQR